MFDLDLIEKDWRENCHALTEEEIIEIFKEDNATLPQYEESIREWERKTHVEFTEFSVEERLLQMIYGDFFGEDPELKRKREREKRLKEIKLAKYPEPQKQHLSKDNQKKIVEGSMNYVFDYVRYYHKKFDEKISEEVLYYLLLETLIKIPKYMIHCGKPVFRFYVLKSFRVSIIDYISHNEKITYREAEKICDFHKIKELRVLGSENCEISTKPSDIKYFMRNEESKDNISDIYSEEFFNDYESILNELIDEEKIIMQLSYDSFGYSGLTYNEISDYLGISNRQVATVKKRALEHLRKNELLKGYFNDIC